MSFDSDEKSVGLSRPVEVWDIVTPTATYRYTTAAADVVYGGNTYTAKSATRSARIVASVDDPPETELSLPVTDPFVQAYAFGTPAQSLTVTITRLQGAAALAWCKGPISGFSVKGDVCSMRVPSPLADDLATTVPSACAQRQCQHVLGDARCTIDLETAAYKTTTTIGSVSSDGMTVTVTSVGSLSGHMVGGQLVRSADSERRCVVSQTGTQLKLDIPFRSAGVGDAVVLYIGCNHDLSDCKTKFGNVVNFGGHPYMPASNPFVGSISGPRFP